MYKHFKIKVKLGRKKQKSVFGISHKNIYETLFFKKVIYIFHKKKIPQEEI